MAWYKDAKAPVVLGHEPVGDVVAALAARPGERESGGALARELGCSGAAVHRHVEALRAAVRGLA